MKKAEQKLVHAGRYMREIEVRRDACETHGPFLARRLPPLSFWLKCPICMREEASKTEEEVRQREAEARRRRWERLLGVACIPKRFQSRSFVGYEADTPEQQYALAYAREYAENFEDALSTGRCAMFLGSPGTGKTHLAAAICMHIMRKGRTAYYTTVLDAIQQILDTRRPGATMRWSDAVGLLTEPDLLVLDEVGVQLGSEFEQSVLTNALNRRYAQGKPVLLLSNLHASGVRDYLGARVFDRLREGDGVYVAFDWESYRGRPSPEAA